MHFFESPPFDFSNSGAQALWELLLTNVSRQRDVILVAAGVGVYAALIDQEQPMVHIWHAVQNKLAKLLSQVRMLPGAGEAIATRLDELAGPALVLDAAPGRAAERGGFRWQGGDEALTGDRNTLLDVSFLQLGTERARAVVRLLVGFGAGVTRCATGFFVAFDPVVTNHHLLHDLGGGGAPASSLEVWFDYERGSNGTHRPVTSVRALHESICGESASDWATAGLAEAAPGDALPLASSPTLPVGMADPVYVVQHPAVRPKNVAASHPDPRRAHDIE